MGCGAGDVHTSLAVPYKSTTPQPTSGPVRQTKEVLSAATDSTAQGVSTVSVFQRPNWKYVTGERTTT